MGIRYGKSKSVTKGARVNVSASRRGPGLSLSQKVGPLTLNTRGRGSLRLAPGLSFRFGKNNPAGLIVALVVGAVALVFGLIVLVVRIAFSLTVWSLRWLVFGAGAAIRAFRRDEAGTETPPAIQ